MPHTIVGMGGAALAAAVALPGKLAQFPQKGQLSFVF